MDLNDKLKDSFAELKSKADKLKEKLELSTEDARKEFDTQLENVQEWMDENDINSETFKYKSEEAKDVIKTKLEELQVQIALAKADGEDAIREHSKIINTKVINLKNEIEKDYKFRDLKNNAHSKLEELSDSISVLSTIFQYNIEEGKEKWEEKKKELNTEIDTWREELDKIKNKSSEKIDDISDEVSELWRKIKKSF